MRLRTRLYALLKPVSNPKGPLRGRYLFAGMRRTCEIALYGHRNPIRKEGSPQPRNGPSDHEHAFLRGLRFSWHSRWQVGHVVVGARSLTVSEFVKQFLAFGR